MNKKSVESALKWIETYSDVIQFKILVCGKYSARINKSFTLKQK